MQTGQRATASGFAATSRPQPLPAEPLASRKRQSMPLTWELYPDHPGYGLHPERVWSIFTLAEAGFPLAQVDLFDDLQENDGHLRSVVGGRLQSVSGKEFVIQAGDNRTASIEGAHALAEKLSGVGLNFLDMIEHQLESTPVGYAGSEIEWDYSSQLFYPAWFYNAPHRRWVFDTQEGTGDLRLLTRNEQSKGEAPDPGHWIISQGRHTNPARAGLMRTAVWFAMFKRFAVRDWVVAAEKFGIPYVMGKYARNAPPSVQAELERAVRQLGNAGQSIMPEGTNIEIIEIGQRGGSIDALHPSIVRICEMQMSKLFTGSVLTSDTGPSNGGSWALGNVHANVRFDLVMADERRLANVFARDIGKPFMQWNGFPGAPPLLKHHITQEVDQTKRMQVFKLAIDMGYPLGADQVGEEMGLRPASEGSALEPRAAAPPPVGNPDDEKDKEPDDE